MLGQKKGNSISAFLNFVETRDIKQKEFLINVEKDNFKQNLLGVLVCRDNCQCVTNPRLSAREFLVVDQTPEKYETGL